MSCANQALQGIMSAVQACTLKSGAGVRSLFVPDPYLVQSSVDLSLASLRGARAAGAAEGTVNLRLG